MHDPKLGPDLVISAPLLNPRARASNSFEFVDEMGGRRTWETIDLKDVTKYVD